MNAQTQRDSVKSYPNAPKKRCTPSAQQERPNTSPKREIMPKRPGKNNRTRPNTLAKTRPRQQAAEQRASHLGYGNPSMTRVDALLVLRAAKRMTLAVGLILQ
jgi:hypothetical protein